MKTVLGILGWVVVGCASLPQVIEPRVESPPVPATERFHLLCHGWHTSVAVRAADLNCRLPELARRFPKARYYEIGWGDAGVYQALKITPGLALRAMFHSPGTVVQVVAFREPPARYFSTSKVREITASPDHYQNLLSFLATSFAKGSDGHVIARGPGLYADGQFYSAVGTYHLCNTCNNWTAKALYCAGVDIEPALKVTASSVLAASPGEAKRVGPGGRAAP